MTNEDMIGSSAQTEGAHGDEEGLHMAEELKPAPAVAQDYVEKASTVFDEAKKRVRTLREDGEDYVRKNPTKAVFTALGVGFVLALIYRH